MKKVITLDEAVREIKSVFKGATIEKTWDEENVTEVTFNFNGISLELFSTSDPYFNENHLYEIFEN